MAVYVQWGDRKRGQHGPVGYKDGQEAIVVYVQWGVSPEKC